ncbi:uncharacterized protein PgNI_00415 [Pyricularia grisea]|uniref:Secreted protein n=1 Tax=Pyricularia grisea TaxID=148305 RepID=A0A6P8BMB7_PYRGI|nr:uncharacterized protein PgNI_00415 [Pyricularia grisea]TLD17839.1 hypothetical protein PgNI_00415 [Pyricularia grisea]
MIGSRRASGDGFSLLGLLFVLVAFCCTLSAKTKRDKAGWLAVMRDMTDEEQAPSGHPHPLISLAANPFDFRGAPIVPRFCDGFLLRVITYLSACDDDSWFRPS